MPYPAAVDRATGLPLTPGQLSSTRYVFCTSRTVAFDPGTPGKRVRYRSQGILRRLQNCIPFTCLRGQLRPRALGRSSVSVTMLVVSKL